MKKYGKKLLLSGIALLLMFVIWTVLIQTSDVKPLGQNGTNVGFWTLNSFVFNLTGVNMLLYTITDWLGLVPVFVCMFFGAVGLKQMVERKSLLKVDYDIIILGIYYIAVILIYLVFEEIPINYRPIPVEGRMEASYPSSTTLLVMSVMPTLVFLANRKLKGAAAKKTILIFTVFFCTFMTIGRLVSGVHWFTDIFGGLLLSAALFNIYAAAVLIFEKSKE